MNIKISDYIIEFLLSKNINKTFGYIGGAIAHIYHSIDKYKEMEIINCIHEQGAGFAAEGYARITGKSGVAFATSGPGATNLITPIGSCYFDSVPTMFITGQVNTYEYKYDKPVRQIGFQETDIVSIIKPIVKYAVMVDKVEDIRYELEKAYYLSQEGRKGPVLVDIPMNIQRTEVDISSLKSFFDSNEYFELENNKKEKKNIDEFINLLKESKRPIVLIGGGVRLSNANVELLNYVEKYNIPVVYSLMGKDAISEDYKYNLGLIGSYGNRYGNLALANSDLILVLGSRLDTRQTGTSLDTFAREAKIIQVDVDKNELGSKIKIDIEINYDVKDFIVTLNKYEINIDTTEWLKKLKEYKNKFSSTVGIDNNLKIPNYVVSIISKYLQDEDICVDVGQHQMWTAQSLNIKATQRVLFSGGMGAMGFALPASIGACIGSNKRTVVIAGDGGIQMNIQELEVINRRKLPIKIFVLNNKNLGMVRQFQELYFDKKYLGTIDDYSVPNFVDITKAYGIKARKIDNISKLEIELKDIFSSNDPELINIELPVEMTTVEPKLIVNKPIEDMHPFISKDELSSLMIIKPLEN
ncbi:MAG: thiamine pyrophosphate-binding protein [Arcobacter sp.]|uniref:thiamine pyrophosphate-binding protein n=1 Tax=Arcobacter sp. TaxID=1872629 RepID=UPI00258E464C|nr:thiamine pyrophosphate-binding protein [Arcobacter sp.]MDD3008369.1 thiamine pyrophosphate-binding protein [Arcobacter sp.]MDD3025476.1 thiamine pyrophosphate-binding protein [Aliarcobacter skirrowii]